MINLTEEQARYIFQLLMKEVGAYPPNEDNFVRSQLDRKHPCTEYRFCGKLGFGGKFWNTHGKLYITCYSEDETKIRKRIITKVNKLLAEYQKTIQGE